MKKKANAVVALVFLLWMQILTKWQTQLLRVGNPPLIALVTDRTVEGKANAAITLDNLALDAYNQMAIAAAGGISPWIVRVMSGTDRRKSNAAGALGSLALNTDNRAAIAAAGGIAALIALKTSGTDEGKANAASALAITGNNESYFSAD